MSGCVGVGRLFLMCVFVCECLSVAVFFCMQKCIQMHIHTLHIHESTCIYI